MGNNFFLEKRENGGATGIRTLETVSRLHTFQACAFDHSATAPLMRGLAWGDSELQERNPPKTDKFI